MKLYHDMPAIESKQSKYYHVRNAILNIMRLIVKDELQSNSSSHDILQYAEQRILINFLFSMNEYTKRHIILRLTVVDSLYSTNANRAHFCIEQLADAISSLGSRTTARDYFCAIVNGEEDHQELFSKHYGIRKNLKEGPMHSSLLSKYAYYELLQDKTRYPLGFPIYDSLVKGAYPVVCKMLGLQPVAKFSRQSSTPIKEYVTAINQLREAIFTGNDLFMGYQQFDVLDTYLWRMGKFDAGNLSLLLTEKDYKRFIENIGLKDFLDKSDKFDKTVRKKLVTIVSPFIGCSSKDYMATLRDHWLDFYEPNSPNHDK